MATKFVIVSFIQHRQKNGSHYECREKEYYQQVVVSLKTGDNQKLQFDIEKQINTNQMLINFYFVFLAELIRLSHRIHRFSMLCFILFTRRKFFIFLKSKFQYLNVQFRFSSLQ